MYLVVGLGNPGEKYDRTRHNVGFDIINLCESKYNFSINRTKFRGMYGETTIAGEKVIFLKPQTFMNLSGDSIREIANFYKIPTENIIIIYDDISLEVGRIRIKEKGSSGGHNGIKSIISQMATQEFPRIKVGVGQPNEDLVEFVLGRFSKEEREIIRKTFDVAVEAVEVIISKGVQEAMNRFNSFKA